PYATLFRSKREAGGGVLRQPPVLHPDPEHATPVLEEHADLLLRQRRGVVGLVAVVEEAPGRRVPAVEPGGGSDPEPSVAIHEEGPDVVGGEAGGIRGAVAERRYRTGGRVVAEQPPPLRADPERAVRRLGERRHVGAVRKRDGAEAAVGGEVLGAAVLHPDPQPAVAGGQQGAHGVAREAVRASEHAEGAGLAGLGGEAGEAG